VAEGQERIRATPFSRRSTCRPYTSLKFAVDIIYCVPFYRPPRISICLVNRRLNVLTNRTLLLLLLLLRAALSQNLYHPSHQEARNEGRRGRMSDGSHLPTLLDNASATSPQSSCAGSPSVVWMSPRNVCLQQLEWLQPELRS